MRAVQAAGFLTLAGCSFVGSTSDWTTQLAPAGPCYDANLLDGIDTSSTAEEHAVFACVNSDGALVGFSGLDQSLDDPTRGGVVGVVLAQWLAEVTSSDTAGVQSAIVQGLTSLGDVLDDPTLLTDKLPPLFELAYGVPYGWLGQSVSVSADPMTGGVLLPAMDVAGPLATSLLDDDAWVVRADAVLRSERTVSLLWTLAALPTATDATLHSLGTTWPDLLAETVIDSEDTSNDRWSGATGSSVRDVADAMMAPSASGLLVADDVLERAGPLLQDAATGERMRQMVFEQDGYGRLDALPAQLKYLASVDVSGGSLDGGEDSALTSLVRLLARGDQSVDCSVDLGFFSWDFSLGNLSVSLLTLLGQQDPNTVSSGVDLLGNVLGVPLTDSILNGVADTGVCPAIDRQMVTDLGSIDRLTDPQVDELLPVLLSALAASDGHVDALVAGVHTAYDDGLMPPIEGAVLDLGDTQLASTLTASIGVLVDPSHHYDASAFPGGVAPLDFVTLWALLGEQSADPALEDLSGPLTTLLGNDATWRTVDNAASLLKQPDAQVRGVLGDLQPALQADPGLPWLPSLADDVDDATTRTRVGELVECDGLRAAIAAPATGPVPTLAGWTLDGSLDVLIRTLQVVRNLLETA